MNKGIQGLGEIVDDLETLSQNLHKTEQGLFEYEGLVKALNDTVEELKNTLRNIILSDNLESAILLARKSLSDFSDYKGNK